MSPAPSHATMKEIGDVLLPYVTGHDERLGELLAFSVGRVLLKAAKRGEDWRSQVNEEKLRHIADWLRAALVNNERWLENADDRRRPIKLMKFGSIAQIVQEADKAMLKASQRLSTVKLVEGDEELFEELDDGFYLVRLLTPAALDRESAEMQHCIGNGGYDSFLEFDGFIYLSLRDRFGKAHSTIEIRDYKLLQLQGKQNMLPNKDYIERLIPFIQRRGYAVEISALNLGYFIDDDGWHDIHSLPEDFTVTDSLYLTNAHNVFISHLPKKLTVCGDLYLYDANDSVLPEGLRVDGNLVLNGATNASVLPEGLEVGGDIYLSSLDVTPLPNSIVDQKNVYFGPGKMSAKTYRELYESLGSAKLRALSLGLPLNEQPALFERPSPDDLLEHPHTPRQETGDPR